MKIPFRGMAIVLSFTALLIAGDELFQLSHLPSLKIYDLLCSLHQRLATPPPYIRQIVLVGIDSDTVAQIDERWPYSRATFATVIARLHEARARAIGFDFILFGDSTDPEGDARLRRAIVSGQGAILAATLKEGGGILLPTFLGPQAEQFSGVVNKLQDPDGVTRQALTYLVGSAAGISKRRIFSWEMKLLEASIAADLSSLDDRGETLILRAPQGERRMPVDSVTKTFFIRFWAHTGDFQRFSFYDILNDRFDPAALENKIVLIGPLSELLQDLHRTPIGWLPGLTLNANTFLTLLANDFLKPVPWVLEKMVAALGMLLAAWPAFGRSLRRAGMQVALEVSLFWAVSFLLFCRGYTWNYALLPLGAIAVAGLLRVGRRAPRIRPFFLEEN